MPEEGVIENSGPTLWYAVRTRSNFERKAAEALRGKGYEEFLPTYRSRRQWSDRKKEIELPLFPGYFFCRFDGIQRLPILTTPGVVSIVGTRTESVPVPESEIAAVRAMLQSGLPVGPWPFLRTGQRVVVERGPLAGLEGLIVELKNEYRLVVSVSLLQRSVAAEVDREWVRPVG